MTNELTDRTWMRAEQQDEAWMSTVVARIVFDLMRKLLIYMPLRKSVTNLLS